MRSRMLGSLAAMLMLLLTAPAFADSLLHIWTCKLNDGKTPTDLEEVSSDWLKAAKGMDGGKDLKVYLDYPVAASAGDGEFRFVLVVTDAKTWGVFNTDYDTSQAAEVDEAWFDVAHCSSSGLWNTVEIE